MLQTTRYQLLDFQTTLFSQPLMHGNQVLQQTKDVSKHISNMGVNTARVFEQNSRQIAAEIKEAAAANSNVNTSTTSTTTTKSTNH